MTVKELKARLDKYNDNNKIDILVAEPDYGELIIDYGNSWETIVSTDDFYNEEKDTMETCSLDDCEGCPYCAICD